MRARHTTTEAGGRVTGLPQGGRACSRDRGQGGVVLGLVLAFTLVGTLLLLALLSFAFTGTRAAPAYQGRIDTVQANSDAMNFAIQAMRTDMAEGLDGATSTYTYGQVSVTCVGDPGSGAVIGEGTADRTVSCATIADDLTARVRFFDRGGSKAGVLAEVLSWAHAG